MTNTRRGTKLEQAVSEQVQANQIIHEVEKSRSKRQIKLDEARIEKAYREACSGVQINMMDISKVFKIGHVAIIRGADDEALRKTLRAFVETIRVG